MSTKLKTIAGAVIPLLLGLAFTVYSYCSFSPAERDVMKSYFVTADYYYVSLSLALAVSGYVLRAHRWRHTLAQIGVKPEFRLNFLAVSVGYFVNLTIPRSGEFSRALVLKNYRGVPFDKAFGTIVAERIVDFFLLLAFILAAVVWEYDTLRDFLLQHIPIKKLLILAAICVAGMLVSLYLYFKSEWKLVLVLKEKVNGLKEGAISIFRIPHKGMFLLETLLIWISYVLMFYTTTLALDETSGISFGSVLVAFVIGSLVIAFTNGGFGFFPPLVASILFLYAVPREAGTAFGWIVWTSQFVITVFLGIFGFLALTFTAKTKI
ncbi:MAG TPA: lysylphosphatidylglycerol synthase transmembrane domain-containing protein [Flavobacterium sp.]|nr:lysylphosphatidylglycerol synthase transmembrane domain-containing protein [Flavobacterium sp.]